MTRPIDLLVLAEEVVTMQGSNGKPKTGKALQDIGIIRNGAVAIDKGSILEVGEETLQEKYQAREFLRGPVVLPGFVDCHTHLVFAGSRHQEYEAKLAGQSYAAAHQGGGGIHYTVEQTRKASEEELFLKAYLDLDRMLMHGTTTVEAKSGYGLNKLDELKQLRVAKQLGLAHPMTVVPTFLGAHTIPREWAHDRAMYVTLVKGLLPLLAKDRLADFCDVFCDPLGFSVEESRDILTFAKEFGLGAKVHAEQTAYLGGAELAADLGAVSAEHLDFISAEGIEKMAASGTVAVLLPGVMYHLMEFTKKIPVRQMIEAGVPVAFATDYNPGSCRTQSMQMILQAGARLFRMSYAEVLNASTINAAYALGLGHRKGSLEAGKDADLLLLDCSSHGVLVDNFGVNHVRAVVKAGHYYEVPGAEPEIPWEFMARTYGEEKVETLLSKPLDFFF